MSNPSSLNVVRYTKDLLPLSGRFSSGNSFLDNFLRSEIALDKNFGTTYVWLSQDEDTIVGFYNIGVGSVEDKGLLTETKLGGAIHINEFALDMKFRGQTQGYMANGKRINLSDLLLFDCIRRAEQIRNEIVGFSFITLSSTSEGHSLYLRNGFEDMEDEIEFSLGQGERDCIRMYQAMEPNY